MTETKNESADQGPYGASVDIDFDHLPPVPSDTESRGARRQSLADSRAARAVHMRIVENKSYTQIAAAIGLGSATAAKAAYDRGVLMLIPKEEIEASKIIALQKLDQWERMTLEEYHAKHILVNFGKAVKNEVTGEYFEDSGAKMACMGMLIRIERERRAILGYSAPSKRVLEVVTADVFDKAITQLNEEAAALERQAQRDDLEAGSLALSKASVGVGIPLGEN